MSENLQNYSITEISFEINNDIKTLNNLVRQNSKAIKATMKIYYINKSNFFGEALINYFVFISII